MTALKPPAETGNEETSLARGKVAQPYLVIPQELPELKNKEFAESTPSYGGYGGSGGRGGGYGGRGGAGSSRGGFAALTVLSKQQQQGLQNLARSAGRSLSGAGNTSFDNQGRAQMQLNTAAAWTLISGQLSGLVSADPVQQPV